MCKQGGEYPPCLYKNNCLFFCDFFQPSAGFRIERFPVTVYAYFKDGIIMCEWAYDFPLSGIFSSFFFIAFYHCRPRFLWMRPGFFAKQFCFNIAADKYGGKTWCFFQQSAHIRNPNIKRRCWSEFSCCSMSIRRWICRGRCCCCRSHYCVSNRCVACSW